MILKETLRQVVKAQRADLEAYDYGIVREELDKIDIKAPHAVIITGIRRCGKSTLLHQLLKKFPNFYYLNFEDTRIANFEPSDFEKLDEIFNEEYGKSEFYLFDEIQNISGWEIFVRSRLDKRKRFVITGSNASLLSKELGTRLTGRHINTELFPFSFAEMLLMTKEKPSEQSFKRYMTEGGFPEYIKYKKSEILRELLNDIIQRDIAARYKIRETKALQGMALYLISNLGKEFSYTSLKKIFDLGSTTTASSFVSYFEDSYLLFAIPKFDYSLKKQMLNEKKIYSVDNGLSDANSASFSSDRGRMLENAVFGQLRRSYKDIFYFKGKGECDFLVKERNRIKMAIQVTYELTEDNKKRELDGLLEAMDTFDLNGGLVITYNQEDRFIIDKKDIIVMPAWKWMVSF